MRNSYLLMVIILAICGCTPTINPTTTNTAYLLHKPQVVASNLFHHQTLNYQTLVIYPAKNPQQVKIFSNASQLTEAYRILGVGRISKYNWLGLVRDKNKLNTMMQQLAAAIGGDAIINVHFNKDNLEAQIIAYQKILI